MTLTLCKCGQMYRGSGCPNCGRYKRRKDRRKKKERENKKRPSG